MDQVRGPSNELLADLLTRLSNPIVTVPSGDWIRAYIDAAESSGVDARVVLDPEVVERLTWIERSRLRDLQQRGTEIRETGVSDLTVRNDDQLAVVDRTTETPVALVGPGETTDVWERATRVEIEVCAREAMIDAVADTVGADAADTFDDVTEAARGTAGDPVAMLLWAAARNEGRLSAVSEVAQQTDVASRSTVTRRLDTLREEGLVTATPIADGGRGRPDKRLSTTVDVPDDSPIPRSVLSLV